MLQAVHLMQSKPAAAGPMMRNSHGNPLTITGACIGTLVHWYIGTCLFVWTQVVNKLLLLPPYDYHASLVANGSAAFKWKLHCHWLKGLWDVSNLCQQSWDSWSGIPIRTLSPSLGPVLLIAYESNASFVANGGAAFKWKMHFHWLQGLWLCPKSMPAAEASCRGNLVRKHSLSLRPELLT